VHERTTDGHRTVIRTAAGPAPIRRGPREGAAVTAYLAPRALAAVDRCQKDWCKIHVGRAAGWVATASVWGADDRPQCR
jgi:SH3-like domain-containing protein